MMDRYVCNDCGFAWYGDEKDCPMCQSTNTGLDVPAPEAMN